VLFVADTHLGFDLPFRPRVERRRRGPDFFANFERALEPAMCGEVDLVVHGGDLFYRSRVPPALIEMAFAPLINVADLGIPVYLVPGNHERSRIPRHLWTGHPRLHIFDAPRTFLVRASAGTVALAGFPFARRVRDEFDSLLHGTDHDNVVADVRLLCMHQTVEGARVGPSNYTFRGGPDVIPGTQIPGSFDCVLSGHIHRSQTLTRDLAGSLLGAPVIYAGSVERTSFAERYEPKHYVLLSVDVPQNSPAQLATVSFVPLPARPMVRLDVKLERRTRDAVESQLRERLARLDPAAVVRVHLEVEPDSDAGGYVSQGWLRALAPPTMSIAVAPPRRHAKPTLKPPR
jgi:DNA repair exonuclease SbcCD nuclease subunit